MASLSRRAIETVEAIVPRVRRRRRAYARIDERIDEQRSDDETLSAGAFRCERCERVRSRFAVGGLANADGRSELWCLECVEHREEERARRERTPVLGSVWRD